MGDVIIKTLIYLCCLVFFMVSGFSYADSLIPLTQAFEIDKGSTYNGQFFISSRKISMFVAGVDSANVSFQLPDGTSINQSNATDYGFDWKDEISSIDDETLVTISSDSAVSGTYFFAAKARTEEGASFSVLETPGLQYKSILGNPSKNISSNTAIAYSVILYHEAQPALEATVNIDIFDSLGNTTSQLTLKDDGQYPDDLKDDGVYTSISKFSVAGNYNALIQVKWNNHNGRSTESISVAKLDIQMSGQYSVNKVDSDGDGLINKVILTFEELTPRTEGEYSITAEITDADGNSITQTSLISESESTLDMGFDVEIFDSLKSQPWKVSSINIWKGAQILGLWTDLGELNIDTNKFERDPLIVTGIADDRGVDSNNDGLFETLEVDITIDTEVSGSYVVSADLRSLDRTTLAGADISIDLNTGINTITFEFMGSNIGGSNENGPYQLANFLIYPNFSSNVTLSQLIALVGETGSYSCREFIGCGADMEAEVIRIAASLCVKLQQNLLKKLNKISVTEIKYPVLAKKQLEALYHRAQALEKSGACSAINNVKGDS
ncbi:MAG: hypothetical protein ACJAZP_003108 [Psychromonas sp.]|jgi:hypothetical protein|uniref:choice-of-anchor X domain-containing protein n=1 Tax=Psychromonas sp. TaxID=1884585 RepID=UPI0039E249D6